MSLASPRPTRDPGPRRRHICADQADGGLGSRSPLHPRQAGVSLRLLARASQPSPAKPSSIIAQVDGSGTVASKSDWKETVNPAALASALSKSLTSILLEVSATVLKMVKSGKRSAGSDTNAIVPLVGMPTKSLKPRAPAPGSLTLIH